MNRYVSAVLRNKRVLVAHVVFVLIVVAAAACNLYPVSPFRQDLAQHLRPPSLEHTVGTLPHLLGTDPLGRDLFSRLLLATRISLLVGFLSTAVACVVGVSLGLLAGYLGGAVDAVIMRLVDALLALPFVVLAIGIVSAVGQSFGNIILVLGITGWVTFAKLVRGEVLHIKELSYVEAARAIGCSRHRILLRYILPGTTGLILVMATLTIGQMIIAEATLGFLGLGIPPPTPTLGGILSDAQTLFFSAWWIVVLPGIFLIAIVLCVNLIGDFLRDYFDPNIKL